MLAALVATIRAPQATDTERLGASRELSRLSGLIGVSGFWHGVPRKSQRQRRRDFRRSQH
jgi:hypothetical protein